MRSVLPSNKDGIIRKNRIVQWRGNTLPGTWQSTDYEGVCVPYFTLEATRTHSLPEEMPTVAAKMVARKAKERIVSKPWKIYVQCEVAQVIWL